MNMAINTFTTKKPGENTFIHYVFSRKELQMRLTTFTITGRKGSFTSKMNMTVRCTWEFFDVFFEATFELISEATSEVVFAAAFDVIFGATFELLFEAAFGVIFASTFDVIFDVTFEVVFDVVFDATFEILFAVSIEVIFEACPSLLFFTVIRCACGRTPNVTRTKHDPRRHAPGEINHHLVMTKHTTIYKQI